MMPKTQQKKRIGKLSPDEDAVAKRVLSGKERIFRFNNADEAIESLHNLTS